jgi:23S rRNA (pseudouridine1915-N3)-methyltransferase
LVIRFRLLAVGRLRPGPLRALAELYAQRLVPPPAIVELEVKERLPAAARKAREAELIIAALPRDGRLVALDAGGEMWSSDAFAGRIGRWRDMSVPEIAFAIGGADGLDAAVLDRATVTMSLGPMTWPHFLARGLLLEQLYRAQQILAGHPYHRA